MSRPDKDGAAVQETTLCLLVRGNPPREVLLGLKKAGFGAGRITGFGGKVEGDETTSLAAARELEEETGIRVRQQDLQPAGQLTFLFPASPTWSQTVHVFVAREWDGIPQESHEMTPVWFPVDDLPFRRMWQDGAHWLPRILAGQKIRARFTFQEDNETINTFEIATWDGENPVQGGPDG